MSTEFPQTFDRKPPLALIGGPTASGKSALALQRAAAQPSVIINADSMQVYAELSVLTARPSADDLTRAPHRLYGYRGGSEPCSAADWAADARREIDRAHREGRLPILVGGTGMYLRTLLDGIAPVSPIDPEVRAEVRALPTAVAYERLRATDPAGAARLNPNDDTRVKRSLEVMASSGRPLRAWQATRQGGIKDRVTIDPVIVLPPREQLYGRCDRRLETMWERAVVEVRALRGLRLHPDSPVMRAIGVPEISAMLSGDLDANEALAQAQLSTRRYAKRQYTWFRNQFPKSWRERTE